MKKYAMRSMIIAAAMSFTLVAAAAQDPDNTKKNKQDRRPDSPTATTQSEKPADLELAKNIRREITSDKSLSLYAHNVKVIVRDGAVVLRGPVRSEVEKDKVNTIAMRHAGATKVTNEIEVSPESK